MDQRVIIITVYKASFNYPVQSAQTMNGLGRILSVKKLPVSCVNVGLQ